MYTLYCLHLVPKVDNSFNQSYPAGLILLKDFITEDEEQCLVRCVAESGELKESENSKI